MFLDKKVFVFQSSKKSYLRFRLSFGILFVVPLGFQQLNEKLYYVVLFYVAVYLNLISGCRKSLWQPLTFHCQYNTLRRLTYYKQSYYKHNGKHRRCLAENEFVISNIFG